MFDDLITGASVKYSIPESWIRAVIDVESAWNPNAYRYVSEKDRSWGLMQLTLPTARGLGWKGSNTDDLFDPALNIELGTKLLAENRRRFGDDFRRIYSAYNSGSPDLWQTSNEVAAHVSRAVAALETYVQSAVTAVTGDASSTLTAILILAILAFWIKKRK